MAALLWLLIPLAAGLAASFWGACAARRRTAPPDADGVAGYERFRAAMERPPSRRGGPVAEPAASSARVPVAAPLRTTPDGPAREAR